MGFECGQVYQAPRGACDLDHLVAGHGGGGQVGAMRGIGDDHRVPLTTAMVAVEGLDHQHARQLAVRPGRGLECRGVHARYLHESPFQAPHQL